LAPTGKDAAMAQSVLVQAGLECLCCRDLDQVRTELLVGAAALLLAEEAIAPEGKNFLIEWVTNQSPWSDLPVLVLARPGADSAAVAEALDLLGNVTVLERPARVAALVSVVRSAVRARQRQYQIRDYFEERERALQTQALLAAIVESSDDAIVSKTLGGIILSWNAGAERLFGYSSSEAVGRSILMLIPPERHEEEPVLIERLSRGERIKHFETVRVAKDGRRLDVSLTVSPIRDARGRVVGASKVARDIGERKRAEALLRDADRRKDEFLAILAHELRNPLAPIRNSLDILQLTNANDPATKRVRGVMERQVNHMVRLVDDLLEVSRITLGKIELRKERLDVAGVVRSAVESSRPLITAARHRLILRIPPEPLILEGDPVRLTQVIANLLNNAAKYTDEGGEISLTVERDAKDVTIAVRDTGTGIAASMLPHVFELFTQSERASGRAQGGLGIGLTLVKNLVELHGGCVEAHSEGPGKGSEFVVRLPRLGDEQLVSITGPEQQPPATLAARRILVVDDNQDAAESLSMLLTMLGADVHVVHTGLDGLEAVAVYQPDVVLLDIGLPDIDGYEVARRIRQQHSADIRLIALTGWGQEEDRRRTRAAGFDHHLIKPADIRALEVLLNSLESPPENQRSTG